MPANDSIPDLSWLADSPAFIDGPQVSAFYEAVVGPAFRTVELQLSALDTEQLEKSAGGHLQGGLSSLFPWLKIDAGVETGRVSTRGVQGGQNITLQPIDSPTRQLAQLSLHYLVNHRDRIALVDGSDSAATGM